MYCPLMGPELVVPPACFIPIKSAPAWLIIMRVTFKLMQTLQVTDHLATFGRDVGPVSETVNQFVGIVLEPIIRVELFPMTLQEWLDDRVLTHDCSASGLGLVRNGVNLNVINQCWNEFIRTSR